MAALKDWISGIDSVAACELEPASADASFRRYFRLQNGAESFIAMDAPPPAEDCLPFVRVAGYLEAMQLNAPRVLEADIENGFLLLTDLGNEPYLERLTADPDTADALYGDAIDALLLMQRRGAAYQARLPAYDDAFLRTELALFRDWLCGTHLCLDFDAVDDRRWQATCDLLVDNALQQPQVFVHRDYHSRNLMTLESNNPGILDFQDAMEGALTYDLVSLLKDCYIRWPAERVRQWALGFFENSEHAALAAMDAGRFLESFELMGVQRQLKAAGIFCRLCHRDGKCAYLDDVPRTLRYILDIAPRYESLAFIADLIETRVLPAWAESV